jgi:hypothetical protein
LWLIAVSADDGEPLPCMNLQEVPPPDGRKKERIEDVALELRDPGVLESWRKAEREAFSEFTQRFETASSRDERRRLLRNALARAAGLDHDAEAGESAPVAVQGVQGVPLGRVWLQAAEAHGKARTVVADLALGDVRIEVGRNEELPGPAGTVNSALLLDRSPAAARRWLAARGIDVRRFPNGEGVPWTVALSPGDAVELHVEVVPGLGEVVVGVEPCSTITDDLGELWEYVRILDGWLMLLGCLTMVILLVVLALIGKVFGLGWFLGFLLLAILSLVVAWFAFGESIGGWRRRGVQR